MLLAPDGAAAACGNNIAGRHHGQEATGLPPQPLLTTPTTAGMPAQCYGPDCRVNCSAGKTAWQYGNGAQLRRRLPLPP